MKQLLLLLTLLTNCALLHAQKREQGYNYAFKPTGDKPRYHVITEKKDSLWFRTAFYLPEGSQAMECSYRDEGAQIKHGAESWFFTNKKLKRAGNYRNGKKEHTWLEYDSLGRLTDSSYYTDGKRKGVQLSWHPNGYTSDSAYFDGAGNGVAYQWQEDRVLSSTGRWVRDTSKQGKWTYYNQRGGIKVTETYNDGTLLSRICFNESGVVLDSAICTETEATPTGGTDEWVRYLQRTLKPDVPLKNRAPVGAYQVAVQFVVDRTGKITDIQPLTRYGYGMEEEAIRVMKKAARWIPADQFGRKVKAYRIQPFTFMVE